jgi:hypothetical protein
MLNAITMLAQNVNHGIIEFHGIVKHIMMDATVKMVHIFGKITVNKIWIK